MPLSISIFTNRLNKLSVSIHKNTYHNLFIYIRDLEKKKEFHFLRVFYFFSFFFFLLFNQTLINPQSRIQKARKIRSIKKIDNSLPKLNNLISIPPLSSHFPHSTSFLITAPGRILIMISGHNV